MDIAQSFWSYFEPTDPSGRERQQEDQKKRLADLVSAAKDQMIRAYGRSAEELGRLTYDLEEAEQRANAIRHRGKTQLEMDRDWSTGYYHGKLDQATGRQRLSLNEVYAAHNENPDWAWGYFRGRLDEARTASEAAYNQARERGWAMAEDFWHSARDASEQLKDKGASVVWSGKEWVSTTPSEETEEGEHHDDDDRRYWISRLYDEIKVALEERARDNRRRAVEHGHQVEDAANRMLEEGDHLGDKFAHLTEEIKSNLIQAQEALMHKAGRVKHKASEKMEPMTTPISKATEKVKEQYAEATEGAKSWFQSAGHDASETAQRVYDKSGSVKDDARDKAESVASDAKYRAEEGSEYLKGKYYDARDKAGSMATDAKYRAEEGADYVKDKYYGARDKAESMATDAKYRAEEGADYAKYRAEEGSEYLKGKYYDARDKAGSMATDAKYRADEGADYAKDKYYGARDKAESMGADAKYRAEEGSEYLKGKYYDARDKAGSMATDARDKAESVASDAKYRAEEGSEYAKDKYYTARDKAEEGAEYVKDKYYGVRDKAGSMASDARDKAESMATDAKYRAEEGADYVKDKYYTARDKAGEGAEYVKDKYYDVRDKAESVASDAKYRAEEGSEYLKGKYYAAHDKAEEDANYVKGKYYDARDKAGSMATDAKYRAEEGAEYAKDKYYGARDKAEEGAEYVKDKYYDAKYRAEEGAEYLKDKYYGARDKAEEGAEYVKDKYYDARDKAGSMARDTKQRVKEGAEQMEDTAHGTLHVLMSTIQDQLTRGGHWTQQHVFDPISHVFTSAKDEYDDIRDKVSEATTTTTTTSTTTTKQQPSDSFIHQTRSMAANELSQQLITLIQQSDQTVRATQLNVDTLEEELGTSLRRVMQHLRRSGLNSRQKRNIAEMDRQQLIMYVRAMLSRVEREARDAYTNVQAIRDDTADKVQHYFGGIMQSYRPSTDVDSLVHDRFHELTRRIMQQANQSETWARRRYEMSRKMRQQAEPALTGDLGEFIDSLRSWLDTAHRVAEQQHEQMMTESRILGKILISEFGAYSDASNEAGPSLPQSPAGPYSSPSRQQQGRIPPGMSRHDKDSHRGSPVGSTVKQWMQWFIGADANADEDRSHLMMPRPDTAISRTVPEVYNNESTTSSWPLVRQWQKAREQIENTYQRWMHGTPLYDGKHHHPHGYDPRRAMADEPPALRSHMTASSQEGKLGYHLLPNRAQQAIDYFPVSLFYSMCLLGLLLGLWGRRRHQQKQMREMSPSAVIHKKVVSPSDEPSLLRRRRRRSVTQSTTALSPSSSSSSLSSANNDVTDATDVTGDIGEGKTVSTVTTVEVLEQSNNTSYTPTGARYASANALVNTTDAIVHIVYTLPIALLILGALEYAGYRVWLLHLLWASFLAGQCIQALRNAATHRGRLWADVGEASTTGVVVLASMLSLYTALSGRPLV